MSRRDRAEEEAAARVLGEVAARAARRLAWLEWVMYLAAALLATLGGVLVAALVSRPLGLPFRPVWMVASMLLFVVPASLSYRHARREERARGDRSSSSTEESDG